MPSPRPIDKYKRQVKNGEPLAAPPKLAPESLPLLPWELEFAEWLANQPKRTSLAEQQEKASELSQRTIGRRGLRNLKDRATFREFFGELQLGALRAARAKLERRMPEYIDAHHKGVHLALDAQDYRAIPAYTNPMIERVWPKRDDVGANVAVVVQLQPKQQAMLDTPTIEVEYEVIASDAS
jgi:hypothetical protein